MGWTLRPIDPGEEETLRRVAALHAETFPEGMIRQAGDDLVFLYYRDLAASPESGVIGAFEAGELAGYVAYTCDNRNLDELLHEVKRRLRKRLLSGRLRPLAALRSAWKRWKGRNVRGMAELAAIAVDPNHRRGGLGGELVRGMEERLRERGCTSYCVFTDNLEGIRFYEKQGFETVFRFRWSGKESACYRRKIGESKDQSP